MDEFEITELLHKMAQAGGSDIFIAAGAPPRMNLEGRIEDLASDPLTPEKTKTLIRQLLTDEQWAEFNRTRELNMAFSLPKVARFRVNVYFQRGTVAAVIRQIRMKIPDFGQLHLPPVLAELITSRRGFILVTGATGTGKSTTMAAMIPPRPLLDGHRLRRTHRIRFPAPPSLIAEEVGIDTFLQP
jgi:Tfp pilus assembly ATPase PilU